ncbi:MAG TPA: hypothetical protein VHJ38_12550, partial [Nitrososphaeraceae archaeon]|nr:hypothetical protein [Nitrososphaeraceae archaeon]
MLNLTGPDNQREKINNIDNIYIFNTLQEFIEKSSIKSENENISKERLEKMKLSDFLKEYTRSDNEELVDKYYHQIKILIFDQFEE